MAIVPTFNFKKELTEQGLPVPSRVYSSGQFAFALGDAAEETITEGTWMGVLTYPSYASILIPELDTPKELSIAGWTAELTSYSVDPVAHSITFFVSLKKTVEAPNLASGILPAIGVGAVVIAVLAVLGLGAIFLTVQEFRKISESPAGSTFGIAFALIPIAIIAFVAYWYFGKRGSAAAA